MRTRAITTGVVIVIALLTGCDAGSSAPRAAEVSSHPPAQPPSAAAAPEVIDVAGLPTGPPPRVAYLAGGSLHWHGRTVRTDLPAASAAEEAKEEAPRDPVDEFKDDPLIRRALEIFRAEIQPA